MIFFGFLVVYFMTIGVASGVIFFMGEKNRLIDDDPTLILIMILLWPITLTFYAGWLGAQAYLEKENKE